MEVASSADAAAYTWVPATRRDFRLYVNNRDVTKLTDAMVGQVDNRPPSVGRQAWGPRPRGR